ncbi:MAG: zinc ABC transporter substrate-binding protein [Clostridia bacterium]|nr:zinc ABC transporter substrate-binding protein [Clostridia bacterium]
MGAFAACGGNNNDSTPTTTPTGTETPAPQDTAKRFSIVTTIFPLYDWVRNLLGENAANCDLTMLLDSGVDLHSYQPTAEDILKVSHCDLFLYVGGESDEWVEDVLAQAENKDMLVVNLLETLGDKAKAEEVKEGMEAEHDHDHGHEHEEIEAEDIKDRTLAEFNGEWQSLYPLLTAGALDAYAEHEAEEDESTKEEALAELTGKWQCDAEKIAVENDTITFTYADGTTASAAYTYAGFSPVLAEDGDIASVRYQFTTDSADAPKYVQFNDHGHEPAEEVEHFHIYFGSESFDALMDSESNPFFVPADWDADAILDELMGEEGHGHHHEEGEEELDEHVWLSVKNAAALCAAIAGKLGEMDEGNRAIYDANAAVYTEKLNALDADYQAAVDAAPVKTVVFGDRFPFRYLVDDYGLDYFAAFVGCSAESEASFETVVFLANKIDELGLKAILQIETADGRIAETIRQNTATKDQTVLTMDSLQSVNAGRVAQGVDYLTVMRDNLEVLKQALT